jgi:hypothetical protein
MGSGASVRLDSIVCPAVAGKTGRIGKALRTDVAYVRLLSSTIIKRRHKL